MLFISVNDEASAMLINARHIDRVEINEDKDDKVYFNDGSSVRVWNFYDSLVEICGQTEE